MPNSFPPRGAPDLRLGKVVGAPGLQPAYALIQRGQCTQNDNRWLDADAAQSRQNGQAIDLIGQHAIQDDDMPGLGSGALQSFGTIMANHGPMTQLAKAVGKIGRASCRERVCQYV